MSINKIEYIRGDKSLLEKFRKTAGLLQKFNSGTEVGYLAYFS